MNPLAEPPQQNNYSSIQEIKFKISKVGINRGFGCQNQLNIQKLLMIVTYFGH